jgi:hypothetical protein
LTNSLLYENNAAQKGGAWFYDASNSIVNGKLVGNTITGNNASVMGGAMYIKGSPKLFNNILWGNTSPNGNQLHLLSDSSEPEIYYCDIEGGKAAFTGSGAGANYAFDYDNAHNLNEDPLFTNSVAGNYSLSGISPCVDTGVPMGSTGSAFPYVEQIIGDYFIMYNGGSIEIGNFDLVGNSRIYNGTIDMGAYEAQQVAAGLNIDLTAFLQGPFTVSDMDAELTNIPLSQPYNASPWNYAGTESVPSIPNTNVVDWVLVELRDASSPGGASSSARLARQAAFILKDGSIVGMDGSSILQFTASLNNNLYAIIWHRNHLGIMSASALTESGGVYTYNFTTAVNKAYLSGQKGLNGKAAMFGGDADANGTVNTADKTVWSSVAGTKGYLSSDMDLNNQVDNKDKNDVWSGNLNEQDKVPD